LHSSAAGDAATRGGRTSREGAGSSPACAISLSPRASGAEVSFMASRRSHVARLQTNSPVSSMKAWASLPALAENATIGGRSEIWLKNEYGERLISPLALIAVIQPIGRTVSALNGS
jgi:hypothetical protein